LFDSLKKKFSKITGKLSKQVEDEAKEENNLEEIAELPQIEGEKKDSTIEEDSTEETSDDEDVEDLKTDSQDSKEDSDLKVSDDKVDETSDDGEDETSDEDNDEDEEKSKPKKKSGFLSFIREKKLSEKDLEDVLWELELGLLEGDVAIDVANAVVESVKEDLVGVKIKRSKDVADFTYEALKKAVSKIISIDGAKISDLLEKKKAEGEPLVIMFVGINGTGKTTTIAKLAHYYLNKGYTPVVAASDTFRAGAIEQITHHTDNIGIKIIKHQKGSDPAAVAYDAVEHAKSKGKELVLIDTAGRMQTNTNLMDEMKKIKRVAKPDLVVFVGDALTGNDAVEQATKFNDAIDIDGVILTKADADSKGGASLSIGYVIQKPILFLGIGQGYDDIIEYDPDWMLNQLFS
jgi:fused signal recognition particle receptor